MGKRRVKSTKRAKTLHKAIACVVPANHVKVGPGLSWLPIKMR